MGKPSDYGSDPPAENVVPVLLPLLFNKKEADMKIQIPGTGCHNCLELELRLAEAISRSGRIVVEVERVDDERSIRLHSPLDAVPGLLIDGHL